MNKEKIARLLPEVFQATVGTNGPLDAFLSAQEHLHEPCESAIGRFPEHLDPRTAAAPFVYMLAYWTDLDYLLDGSPQSPHFAGGVGRLRELVAAAARNGRQRGTEETLIRLLETATGCRGFTVEANAGGTFHFTLSAPREARTFGSLVRRITEAEKPAFTTCELQFDASDSAEGDALDDA
jgi:phage tail-like protein